MPLNTYGPCPTCDEVFQSRAPKTYCTMHCYVTSSEFQERIRRQAKTALVAKLGYEPVREQRACRQCDSRFEVTTRSQKRYCSKSCHRQWHAARFDRAIANPEQIALPQAFDEFLTQAELPCLFEGCTWSGQGLSQHANNAHGIKAADFKRLVGFSPTTGVIGPSLRAALEARQHIHEPKPWFPIQNGGGRGNQTPRSLEGKEKLAKSRAERGSVHVCIVCTSEFVSFASTKTGSREPRFCSTRCKQRWHTDHKKPTPIMQLCCGKCGAEFSASYAQQLRHKKDLPVYCTLLCRQSVNSASSKPGDGRRTYGPETLTAVRRLLAEGLPNRDIAAELGIPASSVSGLKKKFTKL